MMTGRLFNSPAFFLLRDFGKVKNPLFLFCGFWGIKVLYPGVTRGFEEAIFSWFCVNERQERVQKFKVKDKVINVSEKLIQMFLFFCFFENEHSKYFLCSKLVYKHDFAPRRTRGRVDEEFLGNHIFDPWGLMNRGFVMLLTQIMGKTCNPHEFIEFISMGFYYRLMTP